MQDAEQSRKNYKILCLALIKPILSRDGYRVSSVDTGQFDDSELTGYAEKRHLPKHDGLAEGADFVAENDDGHKLLFCFYDKEKEDFFKRLSNRALEQDKSKFRTIWFLVFQTHEEMAKCRQVDKADSWPRGFFLCMEEITEKALEFHEDTFGHPGTVCLGNKSDHRFRGKIKHFRTEVMRNEPVSEKDDCEYFKIRFKAPELKYVVPGQFVMLDTLPVEKRLLFEEPPLSFSGKSFDYGNTFDLKPVSFLKRPFSIHRAFYRYFESGYLRDMSLPPTLATISHTHLPDEFEIFYKVLKNGVGTNELKEVRKGDRIQMLGPLGQFQDLSKWRGDGIEEVHLVGGGVGMAPLVFFGQALKFYSFKLKAFIGIDRMETLLYSPQFAPTYAEDKGNAYVYIETLSGIGLRPEDIRVSCENLNGSGGKYGRLPDVNYHEGLVTEQYASYLEDLGKMSKILAVTCGPQPMLRALWRITSKFDVPMKVLLEKRMAGGIGVCLSCVCRTRKDGVRQYSRVCTEGPLFDAKEIDWE